MKYVVCIPDGCADEPVPELGGRTPLEVASTPTLDALAARGRVGRAQVIPAGLPAGSDVGNMSILGYDPATYHTGRAPIEAASLGLDLDPDRIAFRCNLVTVGGDGTMVDFTGGHPDREVGRHAMEALQSALGGEVSFHPGVGFRNIVVAPDAWLDATCIPPHDIVGSAAVAPVGPGGAELSELMDRSREVLADLPTAATQIWLWGQGRRPDLPAFRDRHGVGGGIVSAVDLVRGLGRLTGLDVVDVEGATAWYDTNYEGKRDAALEGLAAGADLYVIHVEASDEAGHAGDVEEKVRSLENWDQRILTDLVAGLDALGPWRMLVLPDHATPLVKRTHTADAVPYVAVDSAVAGPGGRYTEAGVAHLDPEAGHELLGALIGAP